MAKRVLVSIGTKKGLFTLTGNSGSKAFAVSEPRIAGATVYTSMIDTRGTPTILAGATSFFFGTKVMRSTDLGKTFKETRTSPLFAKKDGRAMKNIWQIVPGAGKRELWCGVEPASLFHSMDGGDSWEAMKGLNDHPHARKWNPGFGGLCLHSIVPIGNRIHVAISSGGHYMSEDGGKTFRPSNKGITAGFQPNIYPEFGQCVHRIASHPATPNRLYGQNHGGFDQCKDTCVIRSDDGGRTWKPIAKGLPTDFGFGIVIHPKNPDTLFVIPLQPETRTSGGGSPAVYRSTNGGGSWQRMAKGFPKKDAYFTVLRDAFTTDGGPDGALYFGTTTGQVWASPDAGESWRRIADSLPPIYSVKAARV